MPNIFDALVLVSYWILGLSSLVMLGGLFVCLANIRLSPRMWLLAFGFAGLNAERLWNDLATPHLFVAAGRGSPIRFLLFLGGIVHLMSWVMIVVGLSRVLADLRRRSGPPDELRPSINHPDGPGSPWGLTRPS